MDRQQDTLSADTQTTHPDTNTEQSEYPFSADTNLRVSKILSYHNGAEIIQQSYQDEFDELTHAIEQNTVQEVFSKESQAVNQTKDLLASPVVMNYNILVEQLHYTHGWAIDHSSGRGKDDLLKIGKEPETINNDACKLDIQPTENWGMKSVDGMKNNLAVEIQFGKDPYVIYDILGKFGHFNVANQLDVGIEVLPTNNLVRQMSSGIGYIEKLEAEFQHLPTDYINEEHAVPTVLLGVDFTGQTQTIDTAQPPSEPNQTRL